MGKAHFFRKLSTGFSPLDLNPVAYIRAWQGVTDNGVGGLTSLDDLTGNGYTFTTTSGPLIIPSGINGLQSIRFNNNNMVLKNEDVMTEITDLSKRFFWIVFKLEVSAAPNTLHTILSMGGSSFTSTGSEYTYVFIRGNTVDVRNYFFNASLNTITPVSDKLDPRYTITDNTAIDSTFTAEGVDTNKIGVQNIGNQNIYIGTWSGIQPYPARMLFSEFGVMKEPPTAQGLIDLKQYFTDTYAL